MSQKYPQEARKKEQSSEIGLKQGRECTHPQRARRQERAKKVQEARAKRTNKEQLERLDKLLGKNKGAQKERARLKEGI